MLLTAWLAQNAAAGFAFGSFGPMITSYERELGVERSLSAAGLPLMLLVMALIGPVAGKAVQHVRLRTLMTLGALLIMLAFVTIAFAQSIATVLVAYGLLMGPGYALLGSMMPSTLVSRWHRENVGKALGIINMPALLGIVPPIVAASYPYIGRQGIFLSLAALVACLLPLTLSIVDHPPEATVQQPGEPVRPGALGYAEVMRRSEFWGMILTASILGSAAVALATHIVPMSVGWGYSPERAAMLLSILGFSGILGSLLFGRLADRVGGIAAMAVICAFAFMLWLSLLIRPGFFAMIPLSVALGTIGGGMLPSLAASINQRFGTVNFSHVFGLFALFNLPLSVGVPMFAGLTFAETGSYSITIVVVSGVLALGFAIASTLHLRTFRSVILAPAGR
jgi:predicted MFS family arabinose efflux permease